MNPSIFISYSNQDLSEATRIVNYLENSGYTCFVSYRDIPVGSLWASAIADAIENCKMMVAVYSDNYNASEQVDREIELCCDIEKKPIITFKISDAPMKGAKKYFLKNLNWINATDDYESSFPTLLEAIAKNIGSPIEKQKQNNDERAEQMYSNTLSHINSESDKFNIYVGRKVTPDMIYQAVGIDQCVYNEVFQGIYETCLSWWKKNPAIYVMIEDNESHSIVGYINAMPLSNRYYHRIRSGETIDVDIPEDEIETYDFPDTYKLYISSVAIHPNFHNTSAFKTLYDAFVVHLLKLYEREIYFSSIVADAVTNVGEKMCKYIGLTHTTDSNHGSKIYEGSLIPPTIRPTTVLCQKLIEAYNNL